MRVMLSGGGTGGHVYPILSVVSALRLTSSAPGPVSLPDSAPDMPLASGELENQAPGSPHHGQDRGIPTAGPERQTSARRALEAAPAPANEDVEDPAGSCGAVALCYVGQAGSIEEELAQRSGIPFVAIQTGQIRGRALWDMIRSSIRMVRGAEQCAMVMQAFRPDVALVTGGYVAAPVAWAAWRARPRVPLLIILPDLTPGLSIRLTSRLADGVAVSFPEVAPRFPGKALVTGYPVRPELLRSMDRAAARKAFGLEDALPVLLVFGGSQGARSINRALVDVLPELLSRCQVIHVSGQTDWPWIAERVGAGLASVPHDASGEHARYHPYPYLHEEMIQALFAADLVVSRAGASVLGEFPAVGLPSILVPYPHAGQHQHTNAAYLADRGAAVIIEDRDLPTRLAPTILELLASPIRLATMAKATSALARPRAADTIIHELYRLAGKPRSPAPFDEDAAASCGAGK